jgi:hypothetical protein
MHLRTYCNHYMLYLRSPVLLAISLWGCTYSFTGYMPSPYESIAIPVFGNETLKYGIEEDLTSRVTQMFLEKSRIRIVEEGNAQSVLRGTVISYDREPFAYDDTGNVTQYRVTIGLRMSYESTTDGSTIWQEDNVLDWGTYMSDTETEEDGINTAIDKLADQIFRLTFEQW